MAEIEQAFLADGGSWKESQIQELFEKISTKKLPYLAGDLKKFPDKLNNLPALTAGVENQGLAFYVPRAGATILKNVISVSANGANTGVMFYQPREFTVLQDSYAIRFKNQELSANAYLFLVGALQKSIRYRFDWSNKAGWERIKYEPICVPYQNGKIAFDYMERIVRQLRAERAKELRAFLKLSNLTDVNLSKDEENALNLLSGSLNWQPFNLKDLFGAATRGKRLKSTDRISGSLPFVTAGEANTGISDFIGNPVTKFKANTVTIDMFGSAKYRNYEYGADDHVAVVHSQIWQKHAVLFLTAAIHKVANAGQFSYSRNFYAKDADELNILLPEKNGKPDTDLMAQIGRAIEKLVIADVVQFNERELAAYESVA